MNRTPITKVDGSDARTFRVGRAGALAFLRSKWLWLLVLCIVAAGVYFFFFSAKSDDAPRSSGKSAANAASRPVPVAGEAARSGDISIYLNGLGTVTPLNTVTVKARVDGQLMKVLFREGQVVKAGELLAEIDPRPYQAMLTQAQGQMARDLALLENAKLDLVRYRALLEQDSIAKQQVDTQAAVVRQYEGTVKIDQGQIDNARLQLTYSRITAPIGGRVGLRQVDPGNIVQASDATGLAVITQLQPITVVFPIAQDSLPVVLGKLQAGEKLTVDAYDRSGKTKLAAGSLYQRRQSDRSRHRHRQAQSAVFQRREPPVPQPVRQRAHAARGQA